MKNLKFQFIFIIAILCSLSGFAQLKHSVKVTALDSSANNYFIVFGEGKSKSVIVSPKKIRSPEANSGRKIKIGETYVLGLKKTEFIEEPNAFTPKAALESDSVRHLTYICTVPKGQVYYIKGKKVPLFLSEDISGLFVTEMVSE